METHEHTTLTVELIDEETTFTLSELCRSCGVEAELIEALVEHGIIEPTARQGSHWCFSGNSLRRARVTLNLQNDLGVNLAGAALALDLMERIEELNARLRALSS